ncbi:hypothetical protein ENBRE01_2198 [Enteropsectra breve]|nr:hypothetical protein ENBRE01_2198 [Enteropsectra breve]
MANDYISNENRHRIINLHQDGRTPADIFRFKVSAVYAIINCHINEGRIERKLKGGPRKVSLSTENKMIIQAWVDEDCGLTLKTLAERCYSELGINVNPSTINRALKSFNYSFKRTHLIPERRNDNQVILKRAEYAVEFMAKLSSMSDENIYYIGDVGFNVSMRTRGGRSLRGTTPIDIVPGLRTRNVSVCCAMNKSGILLYKPQTRAYNSEYLYNFLEELLASITVLRFTQLLLLWATFLFIRRIQLKPLSLALILRFFFFRLIPRSLIQMKTCFQSGSKE